MCRYLLYAVDSVVTETDFDSVVRCVHNVYKACDTTRWSTPTDAFQVLVHWQLPLLTNHGPSTNHLSYRQWTITALMSGMSCCALHLRSVSAVHFV